MIEHENHDFSLINTTFGASIAQLFSTIAQLPINSVAGTYK
ncbi:MAG: hypothetical protein ACPKPY_09890 [Nitrososphaeraceae archaeon]